MLRISQLKNWVFRISYCYVRISFRADYTLTAIYLFDKRPEFRFDYALEQHPQLPSLARFLEQPGSQFPSTIKFQMRGTPFQLKVWEALKSIPAGSTITYSQLAEKVGSKKATRAVASAVGSNQLSVLIPCHRVISKNGDVKYRWGSALKQKLLKLQSQQQCPA